MYEIYFSGLLDKMRRESFIFAYFLPCILQMTSSLQVALALKPSRFQSLSCGRDGNEGKMLDDIHLCLFTLMDVAYLIVYGVFADISISTFS